MYVCICIYIIYINICFIYRFAKPGPQHILDLERLKEYKDSLDNFFNINLASSSLSTTKKTTLLNMGRRKISIQPITDERNRSITFIKRKANVIKKAHELSVLCQVDVAVIILGRSNTFYEFCSVDMEDLLKYYLHDKSLKHVVQEPSDFGDYKKKPAVQLRVTKADRKRKLREKIANDIQHVSFPSGKQFDQNLKLSSPHDPHVMHKLSHENNVNMEMKQYPGVVVGQSFHTFPSDQDIGSVNSQTSLPSINSTPLLQPRNDNTNNLTQNPTANFQIVMSQPMYTPPPIPPPIPPPQQPQYILSQPRPNIYLNDGNGSSVLGIQHNLPMQQHPIYLQNYDPNKVLGYRGASTVVSPGGYGYHGQQTTIPQINYGAQLSKQRIHPISDVNADDNQVDHYPQTIPSISTYSSSSEALHSSFSRQDSIVPKLPIRSHSETKGRVSPPNASKSHLSNTNTNSGGFSFTVLPTEGNNTAYNKRSNTDSITNINTEVYSSTLTKLNDVQASPTDK